MGWQKGFGTTDERAPNRVLIGIADEGSIGANFSVRRPCRRHYPVMRGLVPRIPDGTCGRGSCRLGYAGQARV
jgi:hypothetical protein